MSIWSCTSQNGRIATDEIARIRADAAAAGRSLHDVFMDRVGWPAIPLDGRLLVTHQDALLIGGKVQAPGGYADHVRFARRSLCDRCETHLCADMCSGQAIVPAPGGGVMFDREKCVHCGACLWNCVASGAAASARSNVQFTAGAGGLHSVEN